MHITVSAHNTHHKRRWLPTDSSLKGEPICSISHDMLGRWHPVMERDISALFRILDHRKISIFTSLMWCCFLRMGTGSPVAMWGPFFADSIKFHFKNFQPRPGKTWPLFSHLFKLFLPFKTSFYLSFLLIKAGEKILYYSVHLQFWTIWRQFCKELNLVIPKLKESLLKKVQLRSLKVVILPEMSV